LHKTNIEELEKPIRAFFWASSRNKKKVYWVSWKRICKPKCKGGLGIKNLTKFNISLMCKWWWKLEDDVGPWQDFMWKKYCRNSGIYTASHKQKDSALWSDMLHVKDLYLCGRKMQVGDGTRTHFWGDSWCGHSPLKDKFPGLFEICNDQDITVAKAASKSWRLSFRRWLSVDQQNQMRDLNNILCTVALSSDKDKPIWKWTKNGKFSVKSMYKHLCSNGLDRSFKHLWKAKIPLKIKVWLWLIWHNAIASKDNMIKRGWGGNTKCQFCDQEETILHMFFTCAAAKFVWSCVAKSIGAPNRPASFTQFFWWFPNFFPASRNVQIAGVAAICWAIWKLRNKACFEGKLIHSPVELICYAVVFMKILGRFK
jgi:hypothetical protein